MKHQSYQQQPSTEKNFEREKLIQLTSMMQTCPEAILENQKAILTVVESIESSFLNYPKGCCFLACKLISANRKNACQFSSPFIINLSESCFNESNIVAGITGQILTLLTQIVSEVPSLFACVLKKGKFIKQLLEVEESTFQNDISQLNQSFSCMIKLFKIAGKSCISQSQILQLKDLFNTHLQSISRDPCLLANWLQLLEQFDCIQAQDPLRKKISRKLQQYFEQSKSLPPFLLPGLSKLIVKYCLPNVEMITWLLNNAFPVNGGLAFQIIVNAFSSSYLISQIPLVLDSIKKSQDPEVAAYFLKIVDHVLSLEDSSIKVSSQVLLKWLSSSYLIDHIRRLYFKNSTLSEPVKGAILDFLATLMQKGNEISSTHNIIYEKLVVCGLAQEIVSNKHLLKKNLVQQQQHLGGINNNLNIQQQPPLIQLNNINQIPLAQVHPHPHPQPHNSM